MATDHLDTVANVVVHPSTEDPAPAAPQALEPNRDPLLETFHDYGEQGFPFAVTLYVNGLAVSGDLCSGSEFAFELAKPFSGLAEGTIGRSINDVLVDTQKTYDERKTKPYDEAGYDYVHLKDARTFLPGRVGMPSNGTYMRFKFSTIDGWSIGKLTASTNE